MIGQVWSSITLGPRRALRGVAASHVVLGIVLLLAAGLALASLTPVIGRGYDDGRYAVLGKALAEGAGYILVSSPEMPAEGRYPPGYPLLLAPIWWLPLDLPARIVALKAASAGAAVAGSLVGYLYLVRCGYAGRRWALALVALTSLNPLVFLHSREVLSEMAYMAVSLLGLWSVERYAQERNAIGPRLAVAIAVASGAFYVRAVGLALPAAAVAWLLLCRQMGKAAVLAAGLGAIIAPWLLRPGGQSSGDNASYLSQITWRSMDQGGGTLDMAGLGARLVDNLQAYLLAGLPGAVFPSLAQPTWINLPDPLKLHPPVLVLSLLVSIVLITGLVTALAFRRRLVDLYVGIYLLICLVWPWEPSRFLVPLTLFLYLYLSQPVADLNRVLRPAAGRALMAILLLSLAGYLAAAAVRETDYVLAARGHHYGLDPSQSQLWRETTGAYAWTRENTLPESTLAAINDTQAYLYTGRRSVQALDSAAKLLRLQVDYVMMIPYPSLTGGKDLTRVGFEPVLQANPTAFELMYEGTEGQVRVYRVHRESLAGKEQP